MKPIKLELSAFGPYKGKVEIDFEKIGSQGIFLITGDTGSGKTTIFDGICFALFGTASGSRREINSFRSDFSSDDVPTYVHFSFLHKGIIYNIERIPKYYRKKKRGDGKTLVSGDANLTYLNEVITGDKNVTDKCVEILGMNVNQFRQIVMVAQGEFMELLHAKTKDRAEILRHIFDTGVYKAISDKLKDRYLEKKREYEDSKVSINSYLGSIIWNEELDMESGVTFLMECLEKQNNNDKILEEDLENSRKKLAVELSSLIKDISEGQLLQKSIIDLQKEKENLFLLLLKKNDIQDKNDKLLKSREIWDKVIQVQNLYEDRIKKYEQAKRELSNHQIKYKDLCVQYDNIFKEYQENDKLKEKILELKEQQKIYQEKLSLLDDINTLEKEIELKQLSLNYFVFSEKKEKAIKFQKLHELDNSIQKLKNELAKKNDEYFLLHQRYLDDYHLFLSAQAGMLASSLEDGVACPVCGSLEHPKKATYTGNVLSREELDSELAKSEELKKELDEFVNRIYNLENEITIVKHDLDGVNEEELLNDIRGMESQFEGRSFSKSLEDRTSLEKELSVMEASVTDKKKNIEHLNKDEINSIIDKIIQDIKEFSITIEQIQKKYDEIGKEKISLESAIQVMNKEIVSLESEVASKKQEYEECYRALGYQSKEDYLEFLLSKDEMNEIIEEVRLYQDQLLNVKSHIKALEEFIKDKKNVDLDKKELEKESVSSKIDEIDLSLKDVHSRLVHNIDLFDKIRKCSASIQKQERELMLYKDLSDTANGNIVGQNKLEFEQFVQASYFDRVIESANQRFSYMTDHRFQLMRKDEATRISDKLGLEIEVLDYYTGKKRDIKSLSGGESFKAALSLALGMSDTIQMYSGGVVVDAMFIDEGFGSLDATSLDAAMNAIMMISEGNKMIGIISHVAELQSRIDKKIVVKKSNVGSSVSVIV